jgi:hypothetical protein
MTSKRFLSTECLLALLVAWAMPAAATSVQSSRDDALRWLEGEGAAQGFDAAKNRIVVVESAQIGCPIDAKDWPERRQAAFREAMADCRDAASRFLKSEIQTAIKQNQQLRNVVGLDGIGGAAQPLLDGKRGPIAEKQTESLIEVVSSSAMSGLTPWRVFESADDVTVVASLSSKYSAAVEGRAGRGEPGEGALKWFNGLDDGTLLRSCGTLLRRDERGAFQALAFGQATVPAAGMEHDAIDVAKVEAIGALAHLLGEKVASMSLQTALSQCNERVGLPPEFRSATEFRKVVEAETMRAAPAGSEIGRRIVEVGAHRIAIVALALPLDAAAGVNAPGQDVNPAMLDCPPVPDKGVKVDQVTAKGAGPDRASAVSVALFDAIQQQGALVKGDSKLTKRFTDATNATRGEVERMARSSTAQDTTVETTAKGFIHSFRVLSERNAEGRVEVTVCANVVRFDPKDPRFGLKATVAVLPCSVRPGAVRVAGAEHDARNVMRAVEVSLERALAGSGRFELIKDDPALEAIRKDIADKVRDGRAAEIEAIKLGQQLTADFVLISEVVEAVFNGPPGARPQNIRAADNASATVEARIVNVADNSVIWSDSATVVLKGRDILLVRAGQNLVEPGEAALAPLDLAVARAVGELAESMRGRLGEAKQAAAPIIAILRIANQTLTLDASDPRVRPGARFAVELLVPIQLPGNRVEVDRDRIAEIEVVSVNGGLAKASVIKGDAGMIDPSKCEVVPLP